MNGLYCVIDNVGAKQVVNTELETKSRLCRTLPEVLHDNGALPYFIQFMQAQNVAHLVQFWLSTESFTTASWSRLRSESLTKASKSISEQKPRAGSKTHNDNLSPAVLSHFGGATEDANSPESSPNVNLRNQDGVTDVGLNNNSRTESKELDLQTGGTSVKTHSRAKSDSTAGIGIAKSAVSSTEPGHRRNNSWKGIDPRTGIETLKCLQFTQYSVLLQFALCTS